MIDMLVADLDKEMTEAETEEKNAQADYEEMMADSAEKRTYVYAHSMGATCTSGNYVQNPQNPLRSS